MIRVTRTQKPPLLAAKEANWKRHIRLASTDAARKIAQDKYKHENIKDALIEMFHGKCAYCESDITHIDYGHIEHFRPKGTPAYYELAVDWDNLLLACGRCNGPENKGTKFPLVDKGGPLVNPVKEEPTTHLRFDFDLRLKLANVLGISRRGETTQRTLGLNRPQLLKHRSKFVAKLWVIARRYHEDSAAREIIDSAICPQEEYSAFALAIKNRVCSRICGWFRLKNSGLTADKRDEFFALTVACKGIPKTGIRSEI
jgi:uncharacterized protein (TIGR02646 family)